MKKENIIQQFRAWQRVAESMSGKKINANHFDTWASGYVAGWTLGKQYNAQEIKSLIQEIASSGELKDIGVTGTAIDYIEEMKIK